MEDERLKDRAAEIAWGTIEYGENVGAKMAYEALAAERERALERAAAIARPCETGEDAALEIRSLALAEHLEHKR